MLLLVRHLAHNPTPSHNTSTPQDVVFPLYDQVKPEHVVPGMRVLLAQLHKDIDALEAAGVEALAGLSRAVGGGSSCRS
jgi:oligopeptidase A